jgi:hypothetical protein
VASSVNPTPRGKRVSLSPQSLGHKVFGAFNGYPIRDGSLFNLADDHLSTKTKCLRNVAFGGATSSGLRQEPWLPVAELDYQLQRSRQDTGSTLTRCDRLIDQAAGRLATVRMLRAEHLAMRASADSNPALVSRGLISSHIPSTRITAAARTARLQSRPPPKSAISR